MKIRKMATITAALLIAATLATAALAGKPRVYNEPIIDPYSRAKVALSLAKELISQGYKKEVLPLLHLGISYTFKMDLGIIGHPNRKVELQCEYVKAAIDSGHRRAAQTFLDAANDSLRDVQDPDNRRAREHDIEYLMNRINKMPRRGLRST